MQWVEHGAPQVRRAKRLLLLLAGILFSVAVPLAGTSRGEAAYDQEKCSLCHILESVFFDPSFLPPDLRKGFREDRVCMSCHNGSVQDSRRSLWRGAQHPPVTGNAREAGKDCSACHSPHEKGGWEVLRKTGVRLDRGGDALCTGCHGNHGPRKGGVHDGGILPGGCAECHRAHGGSGRALLREPKERLCLRCHPETASGRSGGHPVRAAQSEKSVRAPLPECTACHSVHRGESIEEAVGKRCAECHETVVGSSGGSGKVHRPGESCLVCHTFHTRAGPDGKGFRKADMRPSGLCGKCHEKVVALSGKDARRKGTHPVTEQDGKTETLCFRCHRIHRAAPGTPLLLSGKAYSCLECHEEQNTIRETKGIILAHPVFERVAQGRLAATAKANRLTLGPAGEIVCETCHSVHRAVPDTPLLGSGFDQGGNCFWCHEEMRGATHISNVKGPGCDACHQVHGKREVEGDPWHSVCSTCHFQKRDHVPGRSDRELPRPGELPRFDERGRKVSVGGAVSCPTCHAPHGGSPNPKMLRVPYRASGFLCTACHGDKELVALTPHDLRGIAGDAICEPCHEPHGGTSPWMWGLKRGDREPGEESCRSCHREKGMGYPLAAGGHPSGLFVTRALPDSFPLFGGGGEHVAKGLMTCPTCHQAHGSVSAATGKAVKNMIRRSDSPAPKRDSGGSICHSCHPGKSVAHGKAPCSECHPPHGEKTVSDACDRCHSRKKAGIATRHLGSERSCGSCHRIHEPGGKEALDARCFACHPRTERIRGTGHAKVGKGNCGGCHPPHAEPEKGTAKRKPFWEPFPPDLPCLRCHEEGGTGPFPKWTEHPKRQTQVPTNYGAKVNLESPIFMTGRILEAGKPLFPLYDSEGKKSLSGRLGCLTCHDPHLGAAGKGPAPGGKYSASGYLRDPSGLFLSELCAPCHRGDAVAHVSKFHVLPRRAE